MTQQKILRKPFSYFLKSHSLRRSMRRRGQALIEMALVVIVLMVLTLGLIQYGLIANAKVTMANLAREGARRAAVTGTVKTSYGPGGTAPSFNDTIKGRVRLVAYSTNLNDIDDNNIVITDKNNNVLTETTENMPKSGELVTVTINYDMRRKFFMPGSSLIPGLNNFGNSTRVSATMVLE